MFFRILKKDLKNRRGVNVILFLFMLLATVFVASSVNNIIAVITATDYCLNKGKVGDKYLCAFSDMPNQDIDTWLSENKLVKDYSKNDTVVLSKDNIVSFAGRKGTEFDFDSMILLQTQWNKNMLIFDAKDGKLVCMKDGEIGMTQNALENNQLKLGDSIDVKFGDIKKTFKVTTVIKDPAYGGDFIGIQRFIISDHDFEEIKAQNVYKQSNYNIETDNPEEFTRDLNKQNFNIILALDRDAFALSYSMPMIMASLLIIVGVCLILIAFLILKFTITYTLQEDYKEIGIMKAIGIREFMIKRIYLVKYFVMVLAASAIGCIISVPVSNAMVKSVSDRLMMERAESNFGVNIICSFIVAAFVLLLCYLCTNRLRKFSAIEAIRNGQTGERYKKHSVLSLHKSKKGRTIGFLAANDILSNIKRYLVLFFTFAIGTIIIILPINVITTFNSDEMIKNFSIDMNADFFIENDAENVNDSGQLPNKAMYVERMEKIKQNLASKGYEVDITTLEQLSFTFYLDEKEDSYQVVSFLPIGTNAEYMKLTDGSFPTLADEIMVSEKQMEKMHAKIGDTLHYTIDGETKTAIISGSYSGYMNNGCSIIFNENAELENVQSSGNYIYQCNLKNKEFTEQMFAELGEKFPDYEFLSAKDCMETWLGGTTSQMEKLKYMFVVLIAAINVLITVLMMKIFISGEKSQIAMMRSIGFTIHAVRMWQTIRMAIVLILGIIFGSIISIPLNSFVLKPIFAIMGATDIKIQVSVWEAYIVYPSVLLFLICLAAYISSGKIKKFNLMEINNPE